MNNKLLILLFLSGVVITGVRADATTNATTKKGVVILQPQNHLQKDTAAFEKVKSMYAEFVQLIASGVNDASITAFFNKHFDVNKITERFTGSKVVDPKLTASLINYFKFLLNGQVIQQVKDFSLAPEFSQSSKKNTVNMMCKLKNNANGVIDMSVTLSRNSQKVLELAFMKSIYLIKGAKTIIDLYCQEKTINYRGLTIANRIKTCNEALANYITKKNLPKT